MKEIKIYLNQDKTDEIHDTIEFEKIVAGEITKKSIFIENIINYPINIKISLKGENINITKNIDAIQPKVIEEVEFEFTPNITIMKPITAQLKIKIDYIIR